MTPSGERMLRRSVDGRRFVQGRCRRSSSRQLHDRGRARLHQATGHAHWSRAVSRSTPSAARLTTSTRSTAATSARRKSTCLKRSTSSRAHPDQSEGFGSGWRVVARKEFADHLHSGRFWFSPRFSRLSRPPRSSPPRGESARWPADTAGVPALFLKLFTITNDPVPFPLVVFIGFLGPAARDHVWIRRDQRRALTRDPAPAPGPADPSRRGDPGQVRRWSRGDRPDACRADHFRGGHRDLSPWSNPRPHRNRPAVRLAASWPSSMSVSGRRWPP